ncbi:MAG: BrnA antitoxin family protein, partial [Spirochaetales bacterium]
MSTEKDPRNDANYREAPEDIERAMGSAKRIEDTLPPPEKLVRKKQSVTIRLDADIVQWFKE